MKFHNNSCPKCKEGLAFHNVEEHIEWNAPAEYRAACPHCGTRIVITIEVVHRIETNVAKDYRWDDDMDDDTDLIIDND